MKKKIGAAFCFALIGQAFPSRAATCKDQAGKNYDCDNPFQAGLQLDQSVYKAAGEKMRANSSLSKEPMWMTKQVDLPEKYQSYSSSFIGIKYGDGLSQVEKLYGPLKQGCIQHSDRQNYGKITCDENS